MPRKIIPISQQLLKETFRYHDGLFYWTKPKVNWIKVDSIAGCERDDGYRVIHFGGRIHLFHRLVYLYFHGHVPKYIDHIDQNPRNNKIENLRGISKRDNTYNTQKLWSHNTSGVRGVSWDKTNQKWTVRFKHNKKYLFLGYFDDIEEAKKARLQKEKEFPICS